jgi:WD40 repeat protein
MVKIINKFDLSNPPPARILTINSRNIEEISFNLPSLTFQNNIPGQNWYRFAYTARMNVSPDLLYILYPFEDTNTPIGDLVVWDRNLHQEAFRIPGLDFVSVEPTWSPDENRFAIGIFKTSFKEIKFPRDAGYDILIADVEGNIDRFNPSENSLGYVNFLSWSPDGKKLAFLYSEFGVEYNSHYAGTLMVLDLETGIITDLCIEGDYYIYWSLDGNYLIFNTPAGFYSDDSRITLVNLSGLWAVDIYDHASVTGVVLEE